MSREFAEAVIDTCVFAVLGTVNEDGTPYCIPLSIARDGEWIYFHGAKEGRKTDNLKHNNQVCISCVGHTHVPDGKFTIEYESAVVFGSAEEVLEEDEKIRGLRFISQRYTPHAMAAFDAAISRQIGVTAVWKVHIDEVTGKRNGKSSIQTVTPE